MTKSKKEVGEKTCNCGNTKKFTGSCPRCGITPVKKEKSKDNGTD